MKCIGTAFEGNNNLGILMMCLGVVLVIMGITGAISDSILSIIVSTFIGGLFMTWVGYEIHVIKKAMRTAELSDQATVNFRMIKDGKIMVYEYDPDE